jgi:hypothetical protein
MFKAAPCNDPARLHRQFRVGPKAHDQEAE